MALEMRIVYVAHGQEPIPPNGWGAVEHVIWQYTLRLRSIGHRVDIINKKRMRAVFSVIAARMRGKIDVVHSHAEKPVHLLSWLAGPLGFTLVSTNHVPFDPLGQALYSQKAVRRCAPAPYHFALRSDYRDVLLQRNPKANVVVFPNGVEVQKFAHGFPSNGKAVCVGRIQGRKRQNEVAALIERSGLECDFVGPMNDDYPATDALRKRWIGPWDKDELYANLGQYGCLVLLSQHEGQPLVVLEALAAGIPVVISPESAQNIDRNLPFVFVVQDEEAAASAISKAIALPMDVRNAARTYAEEQFDYDRLVERYVAQLEKWRGTDRL